jgi:hypothetical protein
MLCSGLVDIWKNIGRFGLGLPFSVGLDLWLSGSATGASEVRQNRTEEPIRRPEDVSGRNNSSPALHYLATYAPLREGVYLRASKKPQLFAQDHYAKLFCHVSNAPGSISNVNLRKIIARTGADFQVLAIYGYRDFVIAGECGVRWRVA